MFRQYRSQKSGKMILSTYDALLKEWGIPVIERDVETRYGQTHILEAGKKAGPPLILFHGVGDDAALMWIYNAKTIGKYFHLYAVDTLGGPGKSCPNALYAKDFDDVLWIDDLLSALSVLKASFVGVSHGGYLVQLYTLLRPEKVQKAVALSSSVPTGGESASPLKTMMKIFLPEAMLPTVKNTQKLLCKLSGENSQAFTENPFIMAHYRWLLKGFNPAAMKGHKVRSFTENEINQIRQRVLYLVGEEDPFQKLGGKEALLSHHMQVIFYPKAGHGLNHEKADCINAKLLAVLTDEKTLDPSEYK